MILMLCAMLALVMFAIGANTLVQIMDKSKPEPPIQVKDMNDLNGAHDTNMPQTQHSESGISFDHPVNLLVLGLDEEELRTDVILLFNYNPINYKLNILSIARDTRVYARGKYSKINALYYAGNESLISSEVQQITGLRAEYYLIMNFKGFRKIVDTLDGVDFNVPFQMDYDDPFQNLHIHLKKGMQSLNGAKAEQLVRYRKGNNTREGYIDGDIGRIKMQQDFLRALISQKMNIRYIPKINDVFNILKDNMNTNLGLSDLYHYLGGVIKVKPTGISTFSLPGESVIKSDIWYYIYDKDNTTKMIEDNFYR